MAKVTGVGGKATGKIGSIVYAVTGGKQIAREYQPIVANPSTTGQITSRSKLKLMSQLSASLASSIAIKREGLVTKRNQFIKINYGLSRVDEGVASIDLNKVQITKSNLGMAGFTADRTSGTKIAVALNSDMSAAIDRAVYVGYRKDAAGSLVQIGSIVVSTPGLDGNFAGELPYTADAVVVYSYGIKLTNEKANAAFGNMQAPSAEQVAKLIATSTEVASGMSLTQTNGATMLVGETSADSDDIEHFSVIVSRSGNGSVSGGGRYADGQTCVLTATPDAEASFVAWKQGNAQGPVLSTNARYEFTVDHDITIVGVFEGGPTPRYAIDGTVSPSGAGTVIGSGNYPEGDHVNLQFSPAAGSQLVFSGWYENGVLVETSTTLTLIVDGEHHFTALCVEPAQISFANMKVDRKVWNITQGTTTVDPFFQGDVSNAPSEDRVILVDVGTNNVAPTVGSTVNPIGTPATVAEFAESVRFGNLTVTHWYYIAVGHGSGTSWTVDAVYQYGVQSQQED